jgi:hypothetical protein
VAKKRYSIGDSLELSLYVAKSGSAAHSRCCVASMKEAEPPRHSLQAKLTKRYSHGLDVQAAFTGRRS